MMSDLALNFFNPAIIDKVWPFLLQGFYMTLLLSAIVVPLGLAGGLLVAMLLPALAAARRASNATVCASNLRQLAAALINYAQDFGGAFPPNSGEVQQFWYKKTAIGRYVGSKAAISDDTVTGGVMICPNDQDDALRSYSMNLFASSYVSSYVRNELAGPRPPGKLYKFGTKKSSEIILLGDGWSELAQPENGPPVGYAAPAVMGFTGWPARRFGAGGGIGWGIGRFGTRESQIAFYRHRTGRNRSMTDPDGAANFAFADGHVALHASRDLADFETGKSKYRALWSENDPEIE